MCFFSVWQNQSFLTKNHLILQNKQVKLHKVLKRSLSSLFIIIQDFLLLKIDLFIIKSFYCSQIVNYFIFRTFWIRLTSISWSQFVSNVVVSKKHNWRNFCFKKWLLSILIKFPVLVFFVFCAVEAIISLLQI